MVKCSFCSSEISFGTGMTFARNDGKLLHFCSSKCRKNTLKLGRKPAKIKWARKAAKK